MASSTSLRRFHLDGVRDTGRVIGDGAYAVVKELEFRGLRCAGKKLHAVLYESASREERADMLRRFAAECQLLGQLHHPHIVQFLGVRVEAGSELPELVMEYLPTTLRRCLDMHSALPSEIGGGILLEVALGLRYLHEFSPPIIHRDVSSNNVLLTTNMTAKISDLGVAKILDVSPNRAARMTQTQAPGTPTFMPPEAMLARPKYTSKVDIFSLGVLVVHILSGEWPMPSGVYAEDPNNPGETIPVNEFERRREFINKIREGHPLLGLIDQCLSNVASRRPDAAEVVRQLQAEHVRVPPRPENRLELLQQVHSLRDELQQSSREEIQALRRENKAVRADIARKNAENEFLCQKSSAQQSRYESERRNFQAQRAEVQKEVEALRAELALTVERSQTETSAQQSRYKSERRNFQAQRAALQREVETLRAELALTVERSQTETESLRAQVQRLTMQPTAPPPKTKRIQSPPGLSPHTRLQWRRGTNAPERFSQAQTVVMGESVYVGGGRTEYKIFQYSWRRGAWSILPECSVRGFGLTQFMGRLTTVGGLDLAGSVTARVYEFISESQRWQESLPPMPTARWDVTVVARPSSSPKPPAIAVCGGVYGGVVTFNTVEVFCHSTSQWHAAEPLPTPLYGLTSASVGDITYLLGGWNRMHGTKHCFQVSHDSLINEAASPGASPSQHGSLWTTVRDTPLTGSCAGSMLSSMVAIGGWDSSTNSPSASVHLLTSSGSWERVRGGDLPKPRNSATAVYLPSGELMVVGGHDGQTSTCTVFIASIAN